MQCNQNHTPKRFLPRWNGQLWMCIMIEGFDAAEFSDWKMPDEEELEKSGKSLASWWRRQ